jgi:hypothetical protein
MVVVVPLLAMARITFINTVRLKPYGYLIGPTRPKRPSIKERLLKLFRQEKDDQ